MPHPEHRLSYARPRSGLFHTHKFMPISEVYNMDCMEYMRSMRYVERKKCCDGCWLARDRRQALLPQLRGIR